MISIGNQELDKVYIGSQEMDKVYIGSTLVFEKSTPPPTPTTLTWSPNPINMSYVTSWASTDYTLSTCTIPANGSYNVTLKATYLRNQYYSDTYLYIRLLINGSTEDIFGLHYSYQNPSGPSNFQFVLRSVSSGDVVTLRYDHTDNASSNFELNGSITIS